MGWDVFTLDYHVDAPINTVFSPAAMLQYLQIFNFLWRLKRVEYTLSASWKKWGKASREFAKVTDIQQDLHFAQLTIQRMVHFIYQLQHYVLFEVYYNIFTSIKHIIIEITRYLNVHGINWKLSLKTKVLI